MMGNQTTAFQKKNDHCTSRAIGTQIGVAFITRSKRMMIDKEMVSFSNYSHQVHFKISPEQVMLIEFYVPHASKGDKCQVLTVYPFVSLFFHFPSILCSSLFLLNSLISALNLQFA